MSANSLDSNADFAPPTITVAREARPDRVAIVWEYFLRLVVVIIGIVLGGILATIIGFATGWIELKC